VYVGLLVVDCRIGEGHSLKEKRHVLLNVTEHLKHSFNIAVAEVEHQDLWQRTKLAIVHVNRDGRGGQSTMDRVSEMLECDPRLQVIDSEIIQLY
jgi:uncharacterized protein YlxP (DUF503 family)